MDYIPKKITLTRGTGFDEETAQILAELADTAKAEPRQIASQLLAAAVRKAKAEWKLEIISNEM